MHVSHILLVALSFLSSSLGDESQQQELSRDKRQLLLDSLAPDTGYGASIQDNYGSPSEFQETQSQYGQPLAESRQNIDISRQEGEHGGEGGHNHEGIDWLRDSVAGSPGEDYPIFSVEDAASADFDCQSVPAPGYYANVDMRCQVFHICSDTSLFSFICPNGTIFNQELVTCDWWFNYSCDNAVDDFAIQSDIFAEQQAISEEQQQNNAAESRRSQSRESASSNYGGPRPSESRTQENLSQYGGPRASESRNQDTLAQYSNGQNN